MSNKSDINPDITKVKPLPPFKMCVLNNFPFIDETFDALTNWELLCKVVEYCNKTGENTNIANENVVKLNNAFLELQAFVNESFDDLNVQTYVNNKIDEMVENGDFEDILISAINSVNPTILKNDTRVNVIDFGDTLISNNSLNVFNNNVFLSTENKPKVINIINDLIKNETNIFYFINSKEDYFTNKIYKLDISSISENIVHLYVYYTVNYLDLNNPTVVYDQSYSVTMTDNLVSDIIGGFTVTRSLYTGSGGSSTGGDPYFTSFISHSGNTYIDFTSNNGGWYFDNNDIASFGELLTDLNSRGINTCIMWFGNDTYPPIACKLIKVTFEFVDSNLCTITANPYIIGESNILSYQYTSDYVDYINLGFNIVDGVFIDLNFAYVNVNHNPSTYLPVDNSVPYEPQTEYEPATKGYVDGTDLTSNLFVDDSNTTTLSNVKLLRVGNRFYLQGLVGLPNGGTWNSFRIYMPYNYLFNNVPASSTSVPVAVSTLTNFTDINNPISLPVYSLLSFNVNTPDYVNLNFTPNSNYTHTISSGDTIAFNVSWSIAD